MIRHLIRRIQADSSGAALVYTLLVTAVLMVVAVAIISVTGIDSKLVLAQEEQKKVQLAAESAVEVIRQELLSEGQLTARPLTAWTPLTLGDIEGQYRYEVTQPPDRDLAPNQFVVSVNTKVTFDSESTAQKDLELVIQYTPGQVEGDQNPEETVNPPADSEPDSGDPEQPQDLGPNVFDYALVGGNMLSLTSGGLGISGDVFSNGSIQLLTGDNVDGNIIAVEEIIGEVNPAEFAARNIEQNHTPPIILPEVHWGYTRGHAGLELDSDGTPVDINGQSVINKIVYVNGDAHVTGGITGSALIVASGNIVIDGDFSFGITGAAGFIAGKNINVIGAVYEGPKINGFLFAGNDVITQGSSSVLGCVVAGNQFQPGDERHVIYHDRNSVDEFLKFVGKYIFANYENLNLSNPVAPPPGAAENGVISDDQTNVGTDPGTGSTSGTAPEIAIIRWKELN